ncbi:MAG: hypothetical protein AAF517_08745, partial [Planctomycetota bacterium]
DVLGTMPEFMHWLNLQSSHAINAHHGRSGTVWESRQYRRVTLNGDLALEGVSDPLKSDDDIVAKMVYTLANPVSAGLVRRGDQWPGLRLGALVTPKQELLIPRPKLYFKQTPELAKIELVRPPCYEELTDAEFGDLIQGRTEECEQTVREEFKATGRTFLGAKRARKVNPDECPEPQEVQKRESPVVAGKDAKRLKERKRQLEAWLLAYRLALLEFRTNASAEFPPGTYLLWKRFGVRVSSRVANREATVDGARSPPD